MYQEIGIQKNAGILVTVSGGMDSMMMLDVLSKLNHRLVVAHCNFQLRGKEADRDTEFVKDYCQSNHFDLRLKFFQYGRVCQSKWNIHSNGSKRSPLCLVRGN